MSSKARSRGLLLVFVLAVCPGRAGADEHVTHPFVGITCIDRTDTSPRPVRMHIVQVDLTAPGVRCRLSPPAGRREAVRKTTAAYLKEEGAQLAVNAHAFLPFPSTDTGCVAAAAGAKECGSTRPTCSSETTQSGTR